MSGDMLPVLSPFVTSTGSMSGVARLLQAKPDRWASIVGVKDATVRQYHFESKESMEMWSLGSQPTVDIEICHVKGVSGVFCPMTRAQRAVTGGQWACGYPLSLVLCIWVHSVAPLEVGDGEQVLVTTEQLQGREQFGVTAMTNIRVGTQIAGCPLTMLERDHSTTPTALRTLPTFMNDATTVRADRPNKKCSDTSVYIHPLGFASSRNCCAVLMNAGYYEDGTACATFVNVDGSVMVEVTTPIRAGQPILVNYKRTIPIHPTTLTEATIGHLLDSPGKYLLKTIDDESWTLYYRLSTIHTKSITTIDQFLYLDDIPTTQTSLETLLSTLPECITAIQCREDFNDSPNTFCSIRLPRSGHQRWPIHTTNPIKISYNGEAFQVNNHTNISWRSAYYDGQLSLFVLYVLLACPNVPVTIHSGIIGYHRGQVIDLNGNALEHSLRLITNNPTALIQPNGSLYKRITSTLQTHQKKWFKVACPHDVITTGGNPHTYLVRIITLEYGEWAILHKDNLTVFVMRSSTNLSRKFQPQPVVLDSPPHKHMCGITFAIGLLSTEFIE